MAADLLRARWLGLWRRIGAVGNGSAIFDDLATRYSEAERAYHTLQHIEHCLAELDRAPGGERIEFAIWFHDAVYDTRAKDNEARSAALAREVARAAGLSDEFIEEVTRLILATRHSAAPSGASEQLIVDIDLAILGQDDARFDEYERQIRAEYSWVPVATYVEARCAILMSFLSRPRIYSTPFFYERYEAAARRNVSESIRRLKE